jgi:exopolysaccharide production protein ExoZ
MLLVSERVEMSDAALRPAPAQPAPRLDQVQFLRFVAAALVIFGHVLMAGRDQSLLAPMYDKVYDFPWGSGVDVFFIISGFIMFYVSRRISPGVDAALSFLWKRAIRIVPLYWTFSALMVLTLLVLPSDGEPSDLTPWRVLSSFLFLPSAREVDGGLRPILAQGWTLNYEVFFYFCFAGCVLFSRKYAMAVISLMLVTAVAVCNILPTSTLTRFYGNTVVIEFLYGGLLYYVYMSGFRIGVVTCILGVAAAMVLLYLSPLMPIQTRFIYWGLPALILSMSIMLCEGRAKTFFSLPVFQRLGDASYALYLCHPFVYHAILLVLKRMPSEISFAIYVPVAVTACLVASVLVNRLYERPIDAMLRRIEKARPTPRPSVAQ